MHLNGLLLAFNGKLLAFGRGAYRAWERAIARPSSRPQRQPYLLTAASALTFAFRISRVKLQQCMRLVRLIDPRCVHAVQWCWWPVWSTSIIIFMQHVDGFMEEVRVKRWKMLDVLRGQCENVWVQGFWGRSGQEERSKI